MTTRLQELLATGTGGLLHPCERERLRELLSDERAGATELGDLLSVRNGFYAFESALLVRPLTNRQTPLGIMEWNAPTLWKNGYDGSLDAFLCFAEDVFGGQFALGREAVVAIDPETGEFEDVAKTLEGWADAVLGDSGYRTGYPLAHDWQLQHGPLTVGQRLVPKVPFVTGGKYVLENLHATEDIEGMRFRGSVARQLRDVPDGAAVTFEVKQTRES